MSKLTLNINQEIIDGAKAYAQRHHTSLSKLVAHFLMELTSRPKDDFFATLHEELLREGYQAPTNNLDDLRQRHVARKYL
jgi:hypothetical protein